MFPKSDSKSDVDYTFKSLHFEMNKKIKQQYRL